MEMGEEPLVKTAACTFRNLCYNNRDSLSAGILVAGWDQREGGQVSESYSETIGPDKEILWA